MATRLKDVQSSMQGDAFVEQQQESVFSFPEHEAPIESQRITYVVFRLVNKKQRRVTIDSICHDVKNPKTGNYETIRLLRGAHSIWSSELVEILKDKNYLNKNRLGLQFLDSICRIPENEVRKLEYARAHLFNVGKNRSNPGKWGYYEYDAAEEQQMRYDARMQRIKTITTINEMEENKMIKLALFLGVTPYEEELGLPRTPQGFRTELLIMADTKPETVNRYLNSQEVDVSYRIRKAIQDSKIDLGGQTGNVIWAGGAGFICKLPQGRKALEYLTELAMTNSREGKQFKEQLETIT